MRHAALVVGAVFLLSGCQQMAWKPGAGPADLKNDTAICRSQGVDEAAIPDCLKRRGWVIRQHQATSDEDVVEAAAETGDASGAAPDSTTPPVAAPTAAASLPSSTAEVQSPAVQSTVVRPAAEAESASPAAAAAVAPISTTAPAARNKSVPTKPVAVDPLAKKVRQSWWKVGAVASDLAADEADCVDKLGPAHQPDLKNRLYTRGMIDCLKAHGWSGY